MTRKLLKSSLAAGFVVATLIQPASAEEFLPVDAADEQLQSRRYEVDDPKLLLHASLAILQDIRYQVTKSEVEPGLLVAEASLPYCLCARSVTISLHPIEGKAGTYQVRITSSSTVMDNMFISKQQPDYTDFYQDFFAQLDRELFKERQQ